MIGLLGIGLALVLGIGMRVAAASGALLLMFMWIAEWRPAQLTSAGEPKSSTNPLIDSHLVDAMLLIALAIHAAGGTWGSVDGGQASTSSVASPGCADRAREARRSGASRRPGWR